MATDSYVAAGARASWKNRGVTADATSWAAIAGPRMPRVCVGSSPLGGRPEVYGHDVAFEQAVATVLAAVRAGMTFLDTAPSYGDGDAERRIGEALRRLGRETPVAIATKVGLDRQTGRYDAEHVRRSILASLERLGVDHVPIAYVHDPERIGFERIMGPGGGLSGLDRLREEGVIGAVGVAGADIALLLRLVRTAAFDIALSHNGYSLVDRSAVPLLDECAERRVASVNAAPLGGGILAVGVAARSRYAYREASPALLQRIGLIEETCAAHSVPIAAAALQFSLRDARIASTVVGMSSPERVAQTLDLIDMAVPTSLWDEIEAIGG